MSEIKYPISTDDVLYAFPRSLRLDLKILRGYYGVFSLEVKHDPSSPFFLDEGDGSSRSLFVPADSGISFLTILNKSYEFDKVLFYSQLASKHENGILFLDIGANVGLISRQCLRVIDNIKALYCYEPHADNFDLLFRNLGGISNVFLENSGLSDRDGAEEFYEDPQNVGNCSLNVRAMPEKYHVSQIKLLSAAREESKWMSHGLPIFYKSDTQGNDELIATNLSDSFWQSVHAGSFELWRLPGKEFNQARFAQILDSFPAKSFESKRTELVSTDTIMKFLDGSDQAIEDLLFWR